MDILQAIILGIVQGITEWLPISSSGHLVLFESMFGLRPPIIFDIMLHVGSLFVVLLFFRKDIIELIYGMIEKDKKSWKMFWMIIIASIPIVLIGYFFNAWIESIFRDLRTVGYSLLFTALILFLSRYPRKKTGKADYKDSVLIGLSQAIAILPGVSRSGSTISAGMMLGIKKEEAAKFSFLIFIPAIIGATIFEISSIGAVGNVWPMIIGTIVSAIVGYFSLRLLMDIIKKDRFSWFSLYCLILGTIVLIMAY